MPKISVVMPAYNAEKYISEAIDSILEQTYSDFEFIIINDCSTDYTEEIILSYDDPRIVYLKNEKNMGVAATLNRGLAIAEGEYIARMDADDISLPERFEKQIAYLESNPAVAALGSNALVFWENGKQMPTDVPVGYSNIKIRMPISNPFIHPTMMLRRSAASEMAYDLAFEGREDYRLWMRMSQHYEMDNLPDVLLRYRQHMSQVTSRVDPQKEEKNFWLKKTYFREISSSISDDMADALCMASYYGKLRSKAQIYDLKAGLEQLVDCLCEGKRPNEYERLIISCARKTGMDRSTLWKLTRGMSLGVRLASMVKRK